MLEVEATGDAIDIEDLAHQMETPATAALQPGGIHLLEGNAAGGDEFLPEGPAAGDGVGAGPQRLLQGLAAAAVEIGPAQTRIKRLIGRGDG